MDVRWTSPGIVGLVLQKEKHGASLADCWPCYDCYTTTCILWKHVCERPLNDLRSEYYKQKRVLWFFACLRLGRGSLV